MFNIGLLLWRFGNELNDRILSELLEQVWAELLEIRHSHKPRPLPAIFHDHLMDKNFSKLIETNADKILVWTNAFNELVKYNSTRFDRETRVEEFAKITDKVASALGEISDIAIKFGAYKDTFDNSKMYLNLYGPSIIINSIKTGVTFCLEADDTGISIRTHLTHINNVNYMDDTFWVNLLNLSEFGHFQLEEHEFYGKETQNKYGNIFNSDKSKIFRILRNYFVGVTENARYTITGDLKITWTSEHSVEDILVNCCKAFKALYNLNYSLWKISDLRGKQTK